ncbi:MAG TPA: hypothetical protein VFB32_10350 [Rudaea sp.]|nr:hypothetical protein [Rudaea sp.]
MFTVQFPPSIKRVPPFVTVEEPFNTRLPPLCTSAMPPLTLRLEPEANVSVPPLAMVSVPPGSTMIVVPLPNEPAPASVSEPPDWMSTVQPAQVTLKPMMGLGITLLMISVVGDPLKSCATSPDEQPGKPPAGDHTAPEMSVQFPSGGGAKEVTLYVCEVQVADAAAETKNAKIAKTSKTKRRSDSLEPIRVFMASP